MRKLFEIFSSENLVETTKVSTRGVSLLAAQRALGRLGSLGCEREPSKWRPPVAWLNRCRRRWCNQLNGLFVALALG